MNIQNQQKKAVGLIKNSFSTPVLLDTKEDFLQSYDFFQDAKNKSKFIGVCFHSHYIKDLLCIIKFFPSNNINNQDLFTQDFIDNGTTFYINSIKELETILSTHEKQALKPLKHLAA